MLRLRYIILNIIKLFNNKKLRGRKNMEYTMNHKYIIISSNKIQSRKHRINRIVIGTLVRETAKSLIFETGTGIKRLRKKVVIKLIDISTVSFVHTQFFIDRIEDALL